MSLSIIGRFSENELIVLGEKSKYPLCVFRLFGYITNFYASCLNSKENIISTQYIYDKKNTKIKIYELEKICIDVIQKLGFNNDIRIEEEVSEGERRYSLFSSSISKYLISIGYIETLWNGDITSFFLPLDKNKMYPIALLQRLEFLIGSYLSEQTNIEGEWCFCNNKQKMMFVLDCLYLFADEEDNLNLISFFRIPHVHRIKLNTDGYLWRKIKDSITD